MLPRSSESLSSGATEKPIIVAARPKISQVRPDLLAGRVGSVVRGSSSVPGRLGTWGILLLVPWSDPTDRTGRTRSASHSRRPTESPEGPGHPRHRPRRPCVGGPGAGTKEGTPETSPPPRTPPCPPRRAPRPSPRRDARRPAKGPGRGPIPVPSGARRRRGWRSAWSLAWRWAAWDRDRPRRLLERAEAATRARDWPAALAAWQGRATGPAARPPGPSWPRPAPPSPSTARPTPGRALERASEADPTDAEVWRARLDLLRVLDRPLEALRLGQAAERPSRPRADAAILALDDPRRAGRAARRRGPEAASIAGSPPTPTTSTPGSPAWPGSPPTPTPATPTAPPGSPSCRRSSGATRATSPPARPCSSPWPTPASPTGAARSSTPGPTPPATPGTTGSGGAGTSTTTTGPTARPSLTPGPWPTSRTTGRSHYGLARAFRALGRDPEARAEAEAVARLRERLDPAALGPRLADDLARLDDPRALLDLAALCEGVGLAGLAEAWRREALARRLGARPSPTDR